MFVLSCVHKHCIAVHCAGVGMIVVLGIARVLPPFRSRDPTCSANASLSAVIAPPCDDTRQYIAYTDGQDVRFASTTKLESIPDRVCRGGWAVTNGQSGRPGAPVTALAFDAVATSLLYVGYGSGEVMVGSSMLG